MWFDGGLHGGQQDSLMLSADKTNQERLADQLSAMEERPHENPVLVANGIMQYKWFRPSKCEQEVVTQGMIQLTAHMEVEDGSDCDSLVGQVMEQGDCNFQPNHMPNKLQKSREDDPHIDNRLKANMVWTKAVNCARG